MAPASMHDPFTWITNRMIYIYIYIYMQGSQEGSQMPPSPPSGGASNHTTPSKRKGTDEDSPDATPSKMRRGEPAA